MNCPKCGYIIKDEDTFCHNCRTRVVVVCEKCHKPYFTGENKCPNCGAYNFIDTSEVECKKCGQEILDGEKFCWKCFTARDGLRLADPGDIKRELYSLLVKHIVEYYNSVFTLNDTFHELAIDEINEDTNFEEDLDIDDQETFLMISPLQESLSLYDTVSVGGFDTVGDAFEYLSSLVDRHFGLEQPTRR